MSLHDPKEGQRGFSFSMSKEIKQIGEPSQQNYDEEKVIIQEPLDVFQIENEMNNNSKFSSEAKDSKKDNNDTDEEQILKAYNHEEDKDSRNNLEFPNIFMSPKFKSFENQLHDEEKFKIVSSGYKSSEKSIEEIKETLKHSGMEMDNESSNQRQIRTLNNPKTLQPSPPASQSDHKEELRRLLGNTSPNQSRNKNPVT